MFGKYKTIIDFTFELCSLRANQKRWHQTKKCVYVYVSVYIDQFSLTYSCWLDLSIVSKPNNPGTSSWSREQ